MCGRFTIAIEPADLQEAFDLQDIPSNWIPRYNVAPNQPVAVIRDADKRQIGFLKWGLVPPWAKDPSIGDRMINARSETIQEKPSFRNAFKNRRCLILADGFYEWKRPGKNEKGPSIPYRFVLKDRKPFAFAGLWELWKSAEGTVINSCTIITTNANGVVAPVHERMPVILRPTEGWDWLKDQSPKNLVDFLHPFPAKEMECYPVSRLVNNANLDNPDCIINASE